jgi:hypothetical protein
MTRLAVIGIARAASSAAPFEVVPGAARLAALCVPEAMLSGRPARIAMARRAEECAGDVLPVAAGVASRWEIARWLERNAEPLGRALARVSGCCELVATLESPAAPGPAAESPVGAGADGLAWLQRRAARRRSLEAERDRLAGRAAAISAGLGPIVRAVRVAPFESPAPGADLAILLPRANISQAVRRLARAARVRGAEAIRVSGPWPCFSFASLPPAAGEIGEAAR